MQTLRNYINGTWHDADAERLLDVENPGTGEVLACVPLSQPSELDAAVAAGREAFRGWSHTPTSQRVGPLFKLAQLLSDNSERIAKQISAEMGKSLPDARAEMKRAIENCQVACGMPTMIQGDTLIDAASGIDGEVMRLPMGVFSAIVPFNFPAMVPFWFLPYAVAAGNTFVLKCSEQVPLTSQAMFELIHEAGFPPGVVNLVNGDKRIAEAMCEHPGIDGISFVGSSNVARIVAESCARSGKRCQALGSAKNYLVVMPDAPLDQVVRNMLTSCLGCAGQRCMAASAIACVGDKVYDDTVAQFVAAAQQQRVGYPLDPQFDQIDVVGPVISAAAKQRIESLIQAGVDEGARLVLDGRGVQVDGYPNGHYIGPTVFADVRPGMTIEQTEIFGPVVIIMKFATLDAAIAAINAHRYGNGASIYTQSGYNARKFKLETQAGMIGINVGIPAPIAPLPFGGMKDSLHADIKAQSAEMVRFFTVAKTITERYWPEPS
jgi:malonate-semialdehyde dehydrogenase (acetylating)/methylmalonate-semialdehyde dehydrogenase